VANSQREVFLSPAAINCVDVTAADTAALDLDLDVIVAKWLGVEFSFMKSGVARRRVYLESLVLIVLGHGSFNLASQMMQEQTVVCKRYWNEPSRFERGKEEKK
jgi:hypothetical protein